MSLVVYRLSLKYRLYPKIRARDVHTRPTPRLGGIAMFLGIVVAFGAAYLLSSQFTILRLIFADPGPILAILPGVAAHRRDRRRRRRLGPRLDDQAGRPVRRGRSRGLARRADLFAADRRDHRRLAPDEHRDHAVRDRAGHERDQLHRRARRPRRGCRAHRQRHVPRLHLPAAARDQPDQLLQPGQA